MVSNTITGIRILWNRVIDLNAKKRKSASGSNFDFWRFINSFTYLQAYIHTYLLKNKKADVLQR